MRLIKIIIVHAHLMELYVTKQIGINYLSTRVFFLILYNICLREPDFRIYLIIWFLRGKEVPVASNLGNLLNEEDKDIVPGENRIKLVKKIFS